MENMDKGLIAAKWMLINRPKIPQRPKNLSAQFVCPSPKVWDFDEKRLHWASVVRAALHAKILHNSQVFLNKAKNWGCHAENTQLGAKKILCLLFDEKLSSLLLHTSWIIIDAKLFQLKWSSLQACTLEFRIDDSSKLKYSWENSLKRIKNIGLNKRTNRTEFKNE